jgi:hypothetical protein
VNEDQDIRVARKAFLGATALAASAAALAGCRSADSLAHARKLGRIVYPVLTPQMYDYARMMATIRVANPHKQVFPATAATVQPLSDIAVIYMHMQFAMNGFQFSLPGGPERLATLGILSGSSVVFGLNDAMWQNYAIGKRFDLAATNVYYRAMSDLDTHVSPDDPKGIYQDWSAQAVLARGGAFMVCHHALTYFATDCAVSHKKNPTSVLAEWIANLMPGFSLVPSGITAMQLAAENGWKIYPVG